MRVVRIAPARQLAFVRRRRWLPGPVGRPARAGPGAGAGAAGQDDRQVRARPGCGRQFTGGAVVTDTSKITASHRVRLCLVYVRQSTLAQTRANTESLERQYELAGRAVALGWDRERVRVVDAGLGLSGADAAGREGFQ